MKQAKLVALLLCVGVACIGCDDAPPQPSNKIAPERLAEAKKLQGEKKGSNGGGVFEAEDPPPAPGEKTGAPEVGQKLKGR